MEHFSVLVAGGSGFIGRHLVAELARIGRRVVVPTRRYERAKHLLVLPTVEIVVADLHDDAQLNGLLHDVDAVINLVGILHSKPARRGEPYGPDFSKVHAVLPRRIVDACARHGIRRYLHMSALGAGPNAPSMYLRSKAAGEAAALSNPQVAATIFRPSVVFGEEDHFLNLFATLQKYLPVMPLAGADAKFQPVYVDDVARAMVKALDNARTFGKIFELAGPKTYTLRELVRLAGIYSGHPHPVIGLPESLGRLQAMLLEHLPGGPVMSRDNLDSMKIDNIASAPPDPVLGIVPTPLEAVAPSYLGRTASRSA